MQCSSSKNAQKCVKNRQSILVQFQIRQTQNHQINHQHKRQKSTKSNPSLLFLIKRMQKSEKTKTEIDIQTYFSNK